MKTIKIGDRFTDADGDPYIVVNQTDPDPLLGDWLLTDWQPGAPVGDFNDLVTLEWLLSAHKELTPAPDTDNAAVVLTAYQDYVRKIRADYDALTPLEQVIQFGTTQWQQEVRDSVADFQRTDQEWKRQQAALEGAAHARAVAMRGVNLMIGNQKGTAKALGLDQSRVSRTIAALNEQQGMTD